MMELGTCSHCPSSTFCKLFPFPGFPPQGKCLLHLGLEVGAILHVCCGNPPSGTGATTQEPNGFDLLAQHGCHVNALVKTSVE